MISSRPNASMPGWMLAKKLGRAKKAWKSFTGKVQLKLHELNIPKTIKTTTKRLLNLRCLRFFVPSKLRALTKTSSTFSRNQYYNHHYQHHNKFLHKNAATIHIDELFAQSPDSAHTKNRHLDAQAETSRGKEGLNKGNIATRNSKSVYSVEDAWQAVVARSPQLRVVDERAEEFIYKFRQDMKLQKERSILEFQEMLARSA
ncbi:hypothetical protein RchiOBHm_Chr4g0393211 [Rosa chinensis]|uniref:DUF761 domain-containing protein n=1 Tax=Rosa chinensis TaxID=74649 RepID=A0A2P6QQX0_ROSCH|nr:uncharacterized protein LOC112198478 [Rosa chinensis]PRQ36584.1 hypothetical protein RchiOBHm_Chr4g0393211 [Rosa chinensis]